MTGILDRQTHPDLDVWRALLRRSLAAIADVQRQAGIGDDGMSAPWERNSPAPRPASIRLGGGTVLSALWGHRYSQDVDLFTHDVQLISYLSPRLNGRIAGLLGTTDYRETATSMKFIYGPGKGSIDIVAATDILPDARPTTEQWEGHTVEIEDPAEIIAKKLFHRGDRATVRDYVDLVEASRQIPDLVARLSTPLRGRIDQAMAVARETSDEQIAKGLGIIRFIRPAPGAAQLRTEALEAMQSIANSSSGAGRAAYTAWQRGPGQ